MIKKIIEIIRLIRPVQWYKNLLIFLPIFFMEQILSPESLLVTFLGFAALCLISSANYIINDIVDHKKDRLHPEKKGRPIASGKIKPYEGAILTASLIAASVAISLTLNAQFLLIVATLFVLTQAYSFFLKKIVIADIMMISLNFVIRAVAGTVILQVETTPWLLICPFFFAMFLATGKRYSDLILLGKKAKRHRKALAHYSPAILQMLIISNTTLLLISYALFSFQRERQSLVLTLPFVIYATYEYARLIYSGSDISRQPHKAIKSRRLVITAAAWLIVTTSLIYLT